MLFPIDVSDDDENEESSDDENTAKNNGSDMRKLLGLDDEEDDELMLSGNKKGNVDDDDSFFGGGDDSNSDEDADTEEGTKSFTYVPGKQNLEEKIRTKLNEKKDSNSTGNELTPWEKYQLKRKEKRKEKKRQAKEVKLVQQGKVSADSKQSAQLSERDSRDKGPSTKEELDLLLAGDNGTLSVLSVECTPLLIQFTNIILQMKKRQEISTCAI